MTARRVRAGARYTYQPVYMDQWDPPYGVKAGLISPGDVVRVVALPGCPRPNTMGHAHIQTLGGWFAGLVCTNSLQPVPRERPLTPAEYAYSRDAATATGMYDRD